MANFVRLKDNIIEINPILDDEQISICFGDLPRSHNLEEICDYWYFYSMFDNEYQVKPIKEYSVQVMKTGLEMNYIKDIKLLIRTDKDLIGVAEMTSEGDIKQL